MTWYCRAGIADEMARRLNRTRCMVPLGPRQVHVKGLTHRASVALGCMRRNHDGGWPKSRIARPENAREGLICELDDYSLGMDDEDLFAVLAAV